MSFPCSANFTTQNFLALDVRFRPLDTVDRVEDEPNMLTTRNRVPALLAAMLLTPCLAFHTLAQSTAAEAAAVPRAVNYSGTAKDAEGKTLAGVAGATFAVYAEQSGGPALWMETQNITAASNGRYAVVLGATQTAGLPPEVFNSGQGRWLGVSYNGGPEQPRVALLSVPYALEAGDAQTIGGLPPSAFVLATPGGVSAPAAARSDAATAAGVAQGVTPDGTSNVTTSGGTVNALPLWTTATNIQSSAITQTGSGSTAKIGIGVAAPASALDVKGGTTMRGNLSLIAAGAATASSGFTSHAENLVASSFDSSTSTPVNQTFQWLAEPAGNDTANPSGTLNLLFGSGTATPAETGLRISKQGVLSFASGQSFPGTGTITGVTTAPGSGLMGGGANGSLNLSLLNTCGTNQVLQWSGSQWGCGSAGAGTITGVTAGTDLTGGGTNGNVTLNLNTTATDARYAQLSAANTFTGNQTVTGNVKATGTVQGTSGFFANSIATVPLTVFQNDSSSVDTAIAATIYSAHLGSTAIQGTALATSGQVFGVEGYVQSGLAFGVYGVDGARSKVGAGSSAGGGVWGDAGTTAGFGVLATSDNGSGLVARNDSVNSDTVAAVNLSETGDARAVSGFANSPTSTRILGQAYDASGIFADNQGLLAAGVNGDTGATGGIGVWGTADSGYAVYGLNNGGHVTGLFLNQSSSLSYGLEAGSLAHNCTIDTAGDLQCTGSASAAVQLPDQRWVRLYTVQSPENWFEDFGSGQLSGGRTTVELDPAFAQTVSASGDYHVFLTPNGDSRGLYVAAKSATSFEVREQGGGASSVAFDYRIVAKRKGYEDVRLADVTEAQNRLMADTKLLVKGNGQTRATGQKALLPGSAAKH
jgi:hypothetical protein